MTTIVWLRKDLRICDNPALFHAAQRGPVLPVFIHERTVPGRPLGAASKWWLHHSLVKLRAQLGTLIILQGDPLALLRDLVHRSGADAAYWNRRYDPAGIACDTAVKSQLGSAGLEVQSFKANVLHEPWEVKTGAGGPFKVYSPFWRACLARPVEAPLPAPDLTISRPGEQEVSIDDLALLPTRPNWAASWDRLWTPGEAGGQHRLDEFLQSGLKGYGEKRNRPDLTNVSRLSPHLAFGEISPRQIWARTQFAIAAHRDVQKDGSKFLSEVGWREFSNHLLFHFPSLPEKNWKPTFDAYPWRESRDDLAAWQRGMTGYPMVDAAMRELWHTGYMHNRARMVAASFLVKHLRIHWTHGEAWFWDTLVDADLANNSAGWQWVTGSGADAAPYFRIFNPVTQGRKFDPDGAYVRHWCPQLARLENKYLHAPFEAPPAALSQAGIVLGETYPRPIVDHGAARAAALAGYKHAQQEAAGQLTP